MKFFNRMRSFTLALAVLFSTLAPDVFAQNFLINKKFVDASAPGGNQVNVLGPGQTAFLEFNLFNSASGSLVANMTDTLPGGMRGDPSFTPIVTGTGCSAAGATLTATASTLTISNFTLPNVPAAGTGPDCRVVFRVIGDPAGTGGNSNVTNTVPAASTSATGPGGPYQSDPFSASIQVLPVVNASIGKAFAPPGVPLNGTSLLSIVITNNAQYPLNNVSLTDSLPAGAVPTGGAATSSCGGTATVTGQNVALAGGTIPAGGTCTITVPVVGTTGGDKNNNIPVNSLTTREGVTNGTAAAATLSVKDNLTILKTHDYSTAINLTQGEVFLTSITFTNNSGALTAATLRDQLPAGVVIADNPNFSSSCGGTFAGAPGTTLVNITGMTIPAATLATGTAGECRVNFWTKLTVATGTLTNTVRPTDVTNAEGKVPEAATSATVTAAPAPGGPGAPGGGNWGYVNTYKDFTDANNVQLSQSTIDVNRPFWMRISAYNPGYDWRFTNGTMTDVLPVGVQVDVPGGPGPITLVDNVDVKYQGAPDGGSAGPNNTTGPYSFNGCANTGTVTVTRSATGQDTITYSGFTTEKGSVSQGFSWYDSGCVFSIRLKGVAPGAYTAGAAPAKPINTIPANSVTFTQPVTNPSPFTSPVTILSAIDAEKSFNPVSLNNAGGKTRLTVYLTNKSAAPETGVAVTDNLPTGAVTAVVATPPNASTTCAGGTVNATAGAATVSISGATIPGGTIATPGRCSFSVDVLVSGTANSSGANVIPPGAITTSTPGLTNIVEARGALNLITRSIILNKTFGNGGAAQGGQPVPLTITVTPDNYAMTNVGFIDSLPLGVTVAPVPNASTTCRTINTVAPAKRTTDGSIVNFPSTTPATVTAVAGGSTIQLANAYFVGAGNAADMGAYVSCVVTVDVVAGTTGNKTNTIPASNATNDQGATNLSPSSATLTVQPNTQLVKAFSPSNVAQGTPFTLTLTVFNVNVSPQTDFFITDTLPANIIADSIASNSCGGTPAITGGGTVIDLPATGTRVGPDGRCDIVVNVRATATGSYTNNQNNLAVTGIINKTTTTTVTVTAPTTFDLSIAKTLNPGGPYTAGASSASYNLLATNNGPGPAQERIVVSDCLPVGLNYTSATGTGWTCVNNAGPITRGALTCSSEVVCTRDAGTGALAATTSAAAITVVAAVAPGASGALVNYAKVAPASGETLTETNLLGTTNGGYEAGSSTGSNNDSSVALTSAISYSLGNRVWIDANNSGTIDAADGATPGRDGVLVELLGPTGSTVIASTTTAGGGYYRFDNLPAGDYRVRIAGSNFAGAGVLVGHASSTPTEADPNLNVDSNDNGIDTPLAQLATLGVTSGVVTLGPGTPEPINESDLVGGAAAGNAAANGGADNTGNMTVDFGFFRLASLGNYVWYDANNDGQQTAGELPVQGVTVTLVDASGTPVPGVPAQTTGANGQYLFTDLPPGTYGVVFSNLPAGYTFTRPLQGGNAANDSDANPTTGRTATVTLAAGDQNLTLDAGLVLLPSLGNYVWYDANNDGQQSPGELPVPGVTVTLVDATGTPVPGVPVQTTGANGQYLFTNLQPGTYGVVFSNLPAGYTFTRPLQGGNAANDSDANQTTGRTGTVTLAGGDQNLTLDAGLIPLASLGNYVWYDTNRDGQQSPGELPVPGVRVTLVDASGNPVPGVPVQTTGANGQYLFTNLLPGTYGVVFSNLPTGYTFTQPLQGGNPANDSDANAVTGRTGTVTLAAGDQNLTLDAGLIPLAGVAVGNFVWFDNNRNGIQDAGELGVPGVTATISKVGGGTVTDVFGAPLTSNSVVTGSDGSYGFTNLAPGQYIVTFSNLPATYLVTPTNAAGSTIDNDSNGLIATSRVLAAGEADLTLDLGISPTFALGNRVWLDLNNNGSVDAGEPGLDGIAVRLLNASGAVVASTTTAGGGYYLFSGLAAGTYTVEIDPPANHVTSTGTNGSATGPFEAGSTDFTLAGDNKDHGTKQANGAIRSAPVTLGPGLQPLTEARAPSSTDATPDANTNLTVDFGVFLPAKLGNLVWIDSGAGGGIPNNGKQDGTEVGLNGVTVRVLNATGAVIASTVTANDPATGKPGWYEVSNLVPGQYRVEFVAPAGYGFSAKGAAAIVSGSGPDTNNSQATSAVPRTELVTLAAGDNNPQLDAGLVLIPTDVPTLNEWMLMLLALMVFAITARTMRARR